MSESLLIVPMLIMGMMLMVLIAVYVMGPISQAAGSLKAPTRFRLSDFFWLVVQLQVVVGGVTRLVSSTEQYDGAFFFVLALSIGGTLAMWAGSVSCVSKAGVVDGWRRGVFIIVHMPATLIAMVGLPVLITGTIVMTLNRTFEEGPFNVVSLIRLLWLYAAIFASAIIVCGLRLTSTWILKGASSTKPIKPASTIGPPLQ